MGCKRVLRPVYLCQHLLPTSKSGKENFPKTEVRELLDGKCEYMEREVKTLTFDGRRVIRITCAHLTLLGGRCSCTKARAEADGKVPRQLRLFEEAGEVNVALS